MHLNSLGPTRLGLLVFACLIAACGPRAHIPPHPAAPITLDGTVDKADSVARLARALAPLLYVQHDETFPLERVVAVVHPTRRIIAYHLLWRDDANGSWIPFTVPTDEEIVWVGYDSTFAPSDLWTYWHGTLLHTDWRAHGGVGINVQWGKHGSLPAGLIESDLPGMKTLNVFYAFTWLSMPDMLLGRLTRPGPLCFCRSYRRYREFSRTLPVASHIDAVAHAVDARELLEAVFGRPYSRKRPWPPE
jgi:hypothetical protein